MKACVLIMEYYRCKNLMINKTDVFSIFNKAIDDNVEVSLRNEPTSEYQYVLVFYNYDDARNILSKYGYNI